VQAPPQRRGAAHARRPASTDEQPKSAYARSLLDRLDHASDDEQAVLDEAADQDDKHGEPKSIDP